MVLHLTSIESLSDNFDTAKSYLGSKNGAGVKERIIAHMPPHDVYVETHLGSGMVLRHKPPARYDYGIDADKSVIGRFKRCYPRHASITVGDWRQTIDGLLPLISARPETVLLYHDPPYHPETRTSRHRYNFDHSAEDHERFLWRCSLLPYRQMISGYWHPVYDKILPTWRRIDYQARTRGPTRTESLWLNFEPTKPHWHSYAGTDSTDRIRIKRKAARWAAQIAAIANEAEKLAILQAVILAADSDAADTNGRQPVTDLTTLKEKKSWMSKPKKTPRLWT